MKETHIIAKVNDSTNVPCTPVLFSRRSMVQNKIHSHGTVKNLTRLWYFVINNFNTDAPRFTQQLHSGASGEQVEFSASRNWVNTWSTAYAYKRESSWNPKASTLKPDQTQHDGSADCVISQQHSSSHCAFIPASQNLAHGFFFVFKNCVSRSARTVDLIQRMNFYYNPVSWE